MTEQDIRRYQLRELVKKLSLLEGHLANFQEGGARPICCHCSSKHAFELEALAEEGVSVLNDLAPTMRALATWARTHEATFEVCALDAARADELSSDVRGFRKQLMAALVQGTAPAPAQPASSGAAAGAAPSPSLHLAGDNDVRAEHGRGADRRLHHGQHIRLPAG